MIAGGNVNVTAVITTIGFVIANVHPPISENLSMRMERFIANHIYILHTYYTLYTCSFELVVPIWRYFGVIFINHKFRSDDKMDK